MIKKLPSKQKDALDKAYKGSKILREKRRLNAVRLLTKGYSHKQAAEILDYKLSYIEDLAKTYNREGISGLFAKENPKNRAYLNDKQKDAIAQAIKEFKTPNDTQLLSLPAERNFWSVATLREFVKKKYGVEYKSKTTYRQLFRRAGFSYQRVQFVDKRRDSQEAEEFRKRFSMKLKKGGMSMSW